MRLTADTCSICGAAASAAWEGQERIAICPQCALEALPALLADAAWLAHSDPAARAKAVWAQAERTFWRALTMRLLREGGPQ